MPRRPIGSPSVLGVAALLAAAAAGAPATASPTSPVSFRLTNTTSVPVSEMYFDPVPRGTILPPVLDSGPDGSPIEGSPMRALPSSTGIDTSSAYVLLTDDPDDAEMERMFLLFGYEPDPEAAPGDVPFLPLLDEQGGRVGELAPGGAFDFELYLAQDSLAYLLSSAVDGLGLEVLDDLPRAEPAPGLEPSGSPIPEPSALLLWAAIGSGGLALLTRRRRRDGAPAVAV